MRKPANTRRARPLTLLVALTTTFACATQKTEPAPEASAAVGTEAQADVRAKANVAAAPRLGGNVVVAGDYQAELAVHENGWVKGLVFDAQGAALAPTRVSDFKVALNAEGDAKLDLTLTWDATCNCFLGNAFEGQSDLAARLVAKPVQLSFNVDGAAQAGALAAYTLLPKLDLSARADLAGTANVKVPSPDVKAKLSAGVQAKAPSADVTVKAPAAKAGATAKASGAVSLPKPSVKLEVKQSAGTSTAPKAGASAGVKAKAGFGFGTK
jgi:hypothetical protein